MNQKEICTIIKAVAQGMIKACETMDTEDSDGKTS